MKYRFDLVVPDTPTSFHNKLESVLRQTELAKKARPVYYRSVIAFAAVLLMLLAGTALAITNSLGLWDFLSSYSDRDIPAETPPNVESVGSSADSDRYVFSVVEAYREGRAVTLLARMSEKDADAELTEPLPWECVQVQLEDGRYLEILDEQQNVAGSSYHAITCILPEDAPEVQMLYVWLEGYVNERIPVAVTGNAPTDAIMVEADRLTMHGPGITFTDFSAEISALNRTLILRYGIDLESVETPALPSQFLQYYGDAEGVYHTNMNCPALVGEAKEMQLKDIVRENASACREESCNPFAEKYEPLIDGIYLELLDAEGNLLPCEMLEDRSQRSEDGKVCEAVFLLDGMPKEIVVRAYDCWTKYRWADTVLLRIQE